MGANTAIFSLVENVVLAPLPYADPDRLVKVRENNLNLQRDMSVSYPDFSDWRRTAQSFERIAAFRWRERNLTGPGTPEHLNSLQISSGFFHTLGVKPFPGREFSAQEDRRGGAPAISHRRFQMLLIVLFAGIALALASVGIYGVISYSVAQRTAEIGIRVALGAQREDILSLVLKQASMFIAMGILGGIAGAFALSRYLSSSLFGIKPSDPATYISVTILLACIALIACLVPARRAARTDPIVALRYE